MHHIRSIITTVTLFASLIIGVQAEHPDVSAEDAHPKLKLIAGQISQLMREHHYDPEALKAAAYEKMEQKATELAQNSDTPQVFVEQFNKLWQSGPFSHVRLDFAKMSAQSLADYIDTMEVGGDGCTLTWDGDTAILTVNTMSGMDTIRQISENFHAIIQKPAKALIIDLRQNQGGTFAVKPLVGHLINKPLDTGVFVSRKWSEAHENPPSADELKTIEPWQGWSVKTFWNDVISKGVLRIQIQPSEEIYSGPVCVLMSKTTASAAEMAADALGQLENVVIIGETSAGQMLSQTMFDLADGLQLSIPIADYFSRNTGHIEGTGIKPDIQAITSEAMQVALNWIQQHTDNDDKAL